MSVQNHPLGGVLLMACNRNWSKELWYCVMFGFAHRNQHRTASGPLQLLQKAQTASPKEHLGLTGWWAAATCQHHTCMSRWTIDASESIYISSSSRGIIEECSCPWWPLTKEDKKHTGPGPLSADLRERFQQIFTKPAICHLHYPLSMPMAQTQHMLVMQVWHWGHNGSAYMASL